MLSLDQLRVFDAIDAHGSFTAAAKELRRATSALSYSVRTLEESLGLTLFDRSHHRATLTAQGRLLVAEARKVLERSAEFERAAARLREGWEPRLVFVVDGLVPLGPIMRAVRSFKELGAVTRLEVHVESVHQVRARFYELDANFMLSLDGVDDASERALPTPPMEMLLVADASHPLVQEQRRVQRSELGQHIQVRASDSVVEGHLSESAFTFSDVRAQREAVLSGVGFGWLPRHLIQDEIRSRRLAIVTFEEGFRVRRIPRIIYRRDRPPGRAGTAFIDDVRAEIDRLVRGPRRRER